MASPRPHPKLGPLPLRSKTAKRSIKIAGHQTSVSLEEGFWIGLKEAAAAHGTTVAKLVTQIADQVVERQQINLSSALRIFVLEFYRNQVEQHRRRRDEAA